MAAHAGTRTRLKKELFKKKEEVLEDTPKEQKVKEEVKETSDAVESVPEEKTSEEKSAESTPQETSTETPVEKSSDEETEDTKPTVKKRLMWIGLLLVYIVILASGGYFMYQVGVRKGEESAKKQMEQQTATKAAEPTPTVVPIDKTQFKIKVLNGSGIAGEAAKAKDLLESAGFTVLSVGNAGSQNNTDTTIEAKDTVKDTFMAAFKETLGKNYKLGEVKTLAAVDPADIIVTLGGKK